MKEPTGNEFSEAIGILNAYYRTLVTRLAEEIIERREQFQVPFLGGAEDLVEKYARPLEQAGALHRILQAVGESLFQEKVARLRPDEYLCFSCRAVMRKVQRSCPQCGWSWRKAPEPERSE